MIFNCSFSEEWNLSELIERFLIALFSGTPTDKYALCLLLKGMSLRTLGYPLQAEESFLKIIEK